MRHLPAGRWLPACRGPLEIRFRELILRRPFRRQPGPQARPTELIGPATQRRLWRANGQPSVLGNRAQMTHDLQKNLNKNVDTVLYPIRNCMGYTFVSQTSPRRSIQWEKPSAKYRKRHGGGARVSA